MYIYGDIPKPKPSIDRESERGLRVLGSSKLLEFLLFYSWCSV